MSGFARGRVVAVPSATRQLELGKRESSLRSPELAEMFSGQPACAPASMAEEKNLDEEQRRQSSSLGSLPVGRSSDCGRRQHIEEARSKAASSYALPCPPDSRRRASRDTLSKSLGTHEFRYAQPVAVSSGRNYHQASIAPCAGTSFY